MVLYLKTFQALKETNKYLKRENLTESFNRHTFLNCQRIKVSLLHVVKNQRNTGFLLQYILNMIYLQKKYLHGACDERTCEL